MQISNVYAVKGVSSSVATSREFTREKTDFAASKWSGLVAVLSYCSTRNPIRSLNCIRMLLSGCFLVVAPLCCNSAEAVLQEPGEANDVLSKSSNISSPATTITPDEFIRELRGWRSNIFNLRLKWKKSSPDESRYGGYVIPDSEIDGYFSIQEFVWEDSGSMTTDIQSFRNNVKTYRQTRGWSTVESMSFDANYNHSNGVGVISKILLEPMASNQAYSNIGIRPLQVGSALEIPIGFPIC